MIRRALPPIALLVCCFLSASVRATTVEINSDSTWRAINPKPATTWFNDVNFDDSTWEFAVKDTKPNDHVWYESIFSAEAPANAWFRKVFTLDNPVSQASVHVWLDDNGQVYLNGTKIIDDNGDGGSSFDLTLDPSLFVVGPNLIAVHGQDYYTPYHTIGVDMTITTGLPGDFNADGKVDAADYVLWRKGTGNNTQSGYATWRTHFGEAAGSGSSGMMNTAVPEPATLPQLILLEQISLIRSR